MNYLFFERKTNLCIFVSLIIFLLSFYSMHFCKTLSKKTNIKLILLAISFFLFSSHLYALGNDSIHIKNIPFISLRADYGSVLNTNEFVAGTNLKGEPIKNFSSFSMKIGNQTIGKNDWEHLCNFPSYGLAFYTAIFDYNKEIGQPFAIYGFWDAPFHRWKSSAFMYQIEFGYAFNWKEYDKNSNYYNISEGSNGTAYIGLGLKYDYLIDKQIKVSLGGSFTHFSNGAIRKPNKGINLASPNISVSYLLKPMPDINRKRDLKYQKNNEIFFALGTGIKEGSYSYSETLLLNDPYPNISYFVMSLSTAYMRQYSFKSKAGAGINLIYDEWIGSSLNIDSLGNAKKVLGKGSDRFTFGIFGAHEFCIDRLSILTQLGCYVWQKDTSEKKPLINERVGVKYHFKNNLFAGVNIYAHNCSKADFLEWNIGYRFKWN